MGNRRNFLKRLAAGMAAGLASPYLAAAAKAERLEDLWEEEKKDEWAKLRKQFVFAKGQAYLNVATLGLMPNAVVEAMEDQIHRRVRQGRYWLEPDATDKIAYFIGANPGEVAITHNTTEGINIVAQGMPLKRGDSVITTTEEHAGNAVPWLNRARRDGIRLKVFRPAPTAAETLQRISDLIDKSTRAIAVPHITCTTGQKLPIREIALLAREKGLYSFVDGAHGAGAGPLDVKSLGVDYYAGCGHKWLCGPVGTGFLYISQERLESLDSIFVGAYSDTHWTLTPEIQQLDGLVPDARRYAYGTQSAIQHAGLVAAVNFMEGVGLDKIEARLQALHDHLRKGLSAIPNIEILTPAEPKSHGAILTFRDQSRKLDAYVEQFKVDKMRVRIVKEAGWDAIRIAPHLYTLPSELDRLIASVRAVGMK